MKKTSNRLAAYLVVAMTLCMPVSITRAQWLSEPNLIHLARNNDWQTYESKRGGFSAQLPGAASWDTEQTKFKGHPITVRMLEVESEEDAYVIGYADLPQAYLAKGSDAVLDDVGRELLDQKMQPLPSQQLHPSLKKYPGRFSQQGLFHMTMKARLHLVDQRMYFIFAASDQEQSINHFLNGFSLL